MAYYPQIDSSTEQINQKVKVFLWHYMNYQQNNQTEQLSVVEFQYNDKKHIATSYTLFKLNFGRYPWKENLTIRMELPKLNDFLEELQRSWDKARILAKEAIKKQFDKKKRNLQGLKARDNVWLKSKNIHSK